jgi:hypothetical protein
MSINYVLCALLTYASLVSL